MEGVDAVAVSCQTQEPHHIQLCLSKLDAFGLMEIGSADPKGTVIVGVMENLIMLLWYGRTPGEDSLRKAETASPVAFTIAERTFMYVRYVIGEVIGMFFDAEPELTSSELSKNTRTSAPTETNLLAVDPILFTLADN